MAGKRDRYHHGDVRRAALDAAILELEAHGHAAFTVERVAKRVGVTAPAIYRHFESRDALLRAVIFAVFERFVARMDAAVLAAPDPEGVLLALGREYVRFAMENPGWFRLQFSRTAIEEHPVDHAAAQPKYPPIVFGALGHLVGDDPAEVERCFLLVWSTAHGVAALSIEHVFGHVTTDEARLAVADGVFAELIRGIVNRR
jgi:AcrR family transcriptional regulator